jgi:hypothetical protein
MLQSHVIDISGTFAGAAVRLPGAYRFIAVDPRVTDLDRNEFPSLEAVKHAVTDRFTASHPAALRHRHRD